MLGDLGFTVLREIPLNTLSGLVTGAYSLHGGVVRDAGGRIVAHLLTSGPADLLKSLIPGIKVLSGLVGSGQLYSVARDVAELKEIVSSVLLISATGTALSGLGLIATVGSTAFLSRKLDGIQQQLKHVERLLTDQHLAVLKGAIDNLRHAAAVDDSESRRAMLIAAKSDFAKCTHFYGSQFADPRTLEEIQVLDDCFALSFVGYASAMSELGMHGGAMAEFAGHYERWRPLAQKHVLKHVVGGERHRLLGTNLVADLPTQEMVATLDFAFGEQKSWAWIDELRREKAGGRVSIPRPWPEDRPHKNALEMGRQLRAKDLALATFGAHLGFLDAKRLTASAFALAMETARSDLDAPAICVLAN